MPKVKSKNLRSQIDVGSRTELKTVEQLTEEFCFKKTTAKDGGNSHKKDLHAIAKILVTNFNGTNRSFQFSDFVIMAAHLDIPIQAQKGFFEKWISFLKDNHRCQSIEGCYDTVVHQMI